MIALLIRLEPAVELTVATRILASLGILAADGRVAGLVGTEVVYIGGAAMTPATMTPYDVAAVRLADGLELAGTPPAHLTRYLDALRAGPRIGAAALTAAGEVETAADLVLLVERCAGTTWADAEAAARASGALVGAYAQPEG